MASRLWLFLAELKRRKVVRVAAVYAVVGVGVVEGAQIIGTPLGLPDWIIQSISLLVVVGFPVALVLAWALEVTPQGVKKTADLTPEQLASQTPEKWKASSWVLSGVGLMAVLVAGYLVFFRVGDQQVPPGESVAETFPEDYVAVFPFENLTGEENLDVLGPYMSEAITNGLNRVDKIRAVNARIVAEAFAARGDGGTTLETAANLGVGTAVTGGFMRAGEVLRVTAGIIRVRTGEQLTPVEVSGSPENLESLISDLRRDVMGALALLVAVEELPRAELSRPITYEAFLSFLRGNELYNHHQWGDALPYFREAFSLDRTYFHAAFRAVDCLLLLEQWAAVDSVLSSLAPRRAEMSRQEQLYFDGSVAWLEGDWERSLQASRVLGRLDPATWAYSWSNDAILAGRPGEALEALEDVDPDKARNSEFGYLWDRFAEANLLTGRYEEALEFSRRGQERFPENLRLRRYEIVALIALGRLDEIGLLLDMIEGMEPEADFSPGSVFRDLAARFARFGYSEESRSIAERGLTWYLARDPNGYQQQRARALLLADRPAEALALLDPLVEESPNDLTNHGLRGIALARTGDQDGAEAEARWCENLDRPYLRGGNTYWRAAIHANLGEKDEAVRLLGTALREGRSSRGGWTDANFKLLWDYEPYEQLIAPKD